MNTYAIYAVGGAVDQGAEASGAFQHPVAGVGDTVEMLVGTGENESGTLARGLPIKGEKRCFGAHIDTRVSES